MNIEHREITVEYLASQGMSETFPRRFLSKIQFTATHWIWMGTTRYCSDKWPMGHGQIQRREGANSKIYVHRAAWILFIGPIPDDQMVLHICPGGAIPYCVNPSHLELGDGCKNMQQMTAEGHNYFSTHKFCGEDNRNSKLKNHQRDEIEAKHASGEFTLKALALEFGVSISAIHRIVSPKVVVS